MLQKIDESALDFTRKKLFLFGPERVDLSLERLEHYTATKARDFQRVILLTNYAMHMEAFAERFPDCIRPSREGVQMPAYHHVLPGNTGYSVVNIGVGPSNAKNLTDHVAVLRPDAMLMIGHCAGVRNHQEIGDFVLASGYLRADRILDDALPLGVPVAPNVVLNRHLAQALEGARRNYRLGTVYTTVDRNWELNLRGTMQPQRRGRHGISNGRGQRVPLSHSQRDLAVHLRQAAAWSTEAARRCQAVLRGVEAAALSDCVGGSERGAP